MERHRRQLRSEMCFRNSRIYERIISHHRQREIIVHQILNVMQSFTMTDRARRHRSAPARAAADATPRCPTRTWRPRPHVSPATCLRRVRRLVEAGVIERRVALLSPERLGAGLTALVEVHARPPGRRAPRRLRGARGGRRGGAAVLPRVARARLRARRAGPPTWPAYHALVQRLFTQDANVRNVKSLLQRQRAKFEPRASACRGAAQPRAASPAP